MLSSLVKSKAGQIALAYATGDILSNYGADSALEAYCYLSACVSNKQEPRGLSVWVPFENYSWKDILFLIHAHAVSIDNAIREALTLTHKGMVSAAINGEFDAIDMNNVDLDHLLERSNKKVGPVRHESVIFGFAQPA